MIFDFMSLQVTGDVILGNQPGNDNADYRFFNYNSNIYFDNGSGRINGSSCAANTRYKFEFGNYYVKNYGASSNLLSGSAQNFTSGTNVYLNNYNNSSFAKTTVYSLIIIDNKVVRNFVPVYSGSNVGLYDIITNQFFGNKGSGSFTHGNNVSYKIKI